MSQSGYLVIADITGYTAFLSQSELEHAKDSLNSLLSLLVEYTRWPLLISRLEGDAVISYALDDSVTEGQTLVELIENTYVAFRKARELMIVNTTCGCRACSNIPNLDLKFFVHHGTYSFQELGGHTELLGTDVNLIHRLTKNSIVESTGRRAYVAYTAAAADALGIEALVAGMVPHSEGYEHIGQVPIFVQDLDALWQREREAARFQVRPEDTLYRYGKSFPLPPAVLWHYLTRPEYRAVIHGSEWQKLLERPGGRLGPGTVYECVHSTYKSRNTIIDWHPFEQYTTVETTPVPRTYVYVTYLLEPVDEGTQLTYVSSKSRGPFLLRQASDLGGGRVLRGRMPESFKAFRDLIDQEIAAGRVVSKAAGDVSERAIEEAVAESLAQDKP